MPSSIVLIEDDDAIADMLVTFFERDAVVRRYANGEDGLAQLRRQVPDVVLLDLNLPGMDGVEVCRAIRTFSQVPVIMLTARDSEIDKVVGLEIGADDYVTKPFSPRELGARMKAVLRRSAQQAPGRTIIEHDEWVVDAGRREVRNAGNSYQPTAKEFDLLWHLADNAGMVLSRQQILESVWGYDYFGETRTVDVHVRQLRKKMPDVPIETVWGVGYRYGS